MSKFIDLIIKQGEQSKNIAPPSNPKEAILSRRNTCYGFVTLANIETYRGLHDILESTRNKVLAIVDPHRDQEEKPRRSPLYIKQKNYHAAVFGPSPLLFEKALENMLKDLLTPEARKKMDDVLSQHIMDYRPYLKPMRCEMMQKDGTILARFEYNTLVYDARPLPTLAKKLDPDGKFSNSKWDPNPNRDKTVTVAICVVDKDKISEEQLKSINKIIEEASQELLKLDNFYINQFDNYTYDKRTLSMKHISMLSMITNDGIYRA